MTRYQLALAAAPFALVAMAAPALADDLADFQPRYTAIKLAMDERDDAAFKKLVTKDFASIDLSGESSDADDIMTRLAMMPVDPSMQTENTLLTITVEGDTAKATSRRSMKMQRTGKDGATHNGEMRSLANDTWARVKGVWLLKSTEVQEVTIFRDGVQMRTIKKGDPLPPKGGFKPGGPGNPPPPPAN